MNTCNRLTRSALCQSICAWLALFKLPVVALLLFSATSGAFVAADGWPGLGALLLLWMSGGSVAAGALALNQYVERHTDACMQRTCQRPLVTGALSGPGWPLALSGAMLLLPPLLLWPHQAALALFLLLGALIYLLIYTLWLKRRTALNVVIGGLAGCCPLLAGGAVVGDWRHPAVLGLALLVFGWTPLHFWSLALATRRDYERAGIPMLPVGTSPRRTAFWTLAHGLAASFIALALAASPSLGDFYTWSVVLLNGLLLWHAVRLLAHPSERVAWRLFYVSNFYLAGVLAAACLDVVL